MSKTLEKERSKVSFNIHDLSVYIFGSEERFKQLQDAYKIMCEDPIMRNDVSILGKSRIDLFKIYARKNLRMHELFNAMESGVASIGNHFSNQMPASLSVYMFAPYIKHLGTDKQVQKWLEPTLRMEVIGCYAQTEMGHGSDVRNLETTATFDPQTDEFIINSPTITSAKWWPGDLAIVANHAICMAQTIVNGENKGVHGFIVPIRDIETHKVLPNIELGDIGEKVGFNTKDNGYCFFHNVRIPRENMLMRYSKVSKKGEYKRQGDERVGYSIMMQIRDMLGHSSWRALSTALVIATRFSLVRTQFQDEEGVERAVMDYQLQQDKIIPLLATCFAINAGASKVSTLTQENVRRIQENEDFSMMKDLHATLCGTKSFYSTDADNGITKARLACGGHGYASYSGFTTVWKEFSPTVTYEGENTIMALQTGRYLINCLQKLRKGSQLSDNVDYLRNLKEILSIQKCPVKKSTDFTIDVTLSTLQANAAYLIYRAGRGLLQNTKEGKSLKESWDKKAGINLVEAARAHMNVYTYKAFMERIENTVKSPALKVVLSRLCILYGVEKMLEHPIGLIESEYMASKQFMMLRQRKEELLEEIRPEVIGLVDAFGYPDNSLKSVLGVYDGNIYEEMLKFVREQNEFNKHDWSETFEKYIKPLRYVQRPKPKL